MIEFPKIPKYIDRLLESGNKPDIEIGLELLTKYFNDAFDYSLYVSRTYNRLNKIDRNKAYALYSMDIWRNYYEKRSITGEDI